LLSPSFRWESLQRWDLGFQGAIGYHRAPWQYFLSHNGISAITKPFTNFSFTRRNSGYHGAFHEFFFHTMEFWLSRSLSRIFLSHDGILAITEPFTNFSFTWWNSGYHGAFHEFFFHTMELWLSRSLSRIFTWLSPWDTWFGANSFHIYYKEYYIGSASLKTLPLYLEPPLQGKEYGPPYSKEIVKSKCFCSRNHL
jgi:hypothetical protein